MQSCKCLCQDGDVSALVDDVCGMSESERNDCLAANLQFLLPLVRICRSVDAL